MSPYKLTPRALADLDETAGYTFTEWGAAQMEEYLRELRDRFEWLAENPKLGRARNDIQRGYRSYRQGQHLIFYTQGNDGIVIIGVPHVSRDLGSFFE